MDRSRLLTPAGVVVLSVLVGILASIGNEVVFVNLLVFLTGILVIWKQNQVLYYLLQERYHVVPLHQVPVCKNSKSTKNKHLNEKNIYSESRDSQKQETFSKEKNAYLDNSEVQKKENFSKMESKQPKESSEKLMLEVRMSGKKYMSGYLEISKYFEEVEDDAVRDKKVRLACELIDHGFDIDKVTDAARNCDKFDTATRYLMQKCGSCAKFFSLPEIVQMFMCTHKLCKGCIKNHVAKALKGRNILDCTCKVCEMPKLESENKALEYLSTLDCYLESILPSEIHQQFHRELMSGTWKTRLKSKESKGSTGTTADNGNVWPKLGSRFNKNSTDLPILGSDSSCSFCGTKTCLPYKMISCEHKLCRSCTTTFFSQLILTSDITDYVCPVCRKPEFYSQEDFFNYFKDFRKIFSYIFDAGTQQSLERKFQDYIDNMNGDYCNRTKSYADAKPNERENCNQLQRTFLHKKTTGKECASKFSSAISSRNSLNDYVEKRQTSCPNCRVHCYLTREVPEFVYCHQCKGLFCETCKASYNNGCGKSLCSEKFVHLHHHEICFNKDFRGGTDKLKIILKANKVDFVDTEAISGVCLLRKVYHCQNKTFRSDLCRYHYDDYLANLILQNNLKTSSNWF